MGGRFHLLIWTKSSRPDRGPVAAKTTKGLSKREPSSLAIQEKRRVGLANAAVDQANDGIGLARHCFVMRHHDDRKFAFATQP